MGQTAIALSTFAKSIIPLFSDSWLKLIGRIVFPLLYYVALRALNSHPHIAQRPQPLNNIQEILKGAINGTMRLSPSLVSWK